MKSNKPTKTMNAMKTMKNFLSMAALALVGAMMTGCSSDDNFDNPQQPENKSKVVTLTTTVGFADDGTTRALTGTGVKTFAAGETMAVIYNNGTSTVKAVSHTLEVSDITDGGKKATFTFDLETPNKSASVLYIYPAAMADDTGVDFTKLNTQEGTFDALQSKYDLCTNFDAWDGDNLPSLKLENQLAILAITLKDNVETPADITGTITSMVVSDGAHAYTVNRSAAAGPIYVAILPTSDATIDVTATDGTNYYTKSLTDKTYAASNGYNVSWKMTTEVAARDLSMLDCAGNLRPRSWTANCYMVHTAGDYKLPLVYGNAIKNGATNTAAYTGVSGQLETFPRHDGSAITTPWIKDNGITVATAELLWQDAEGLITAVGIDGDYLTLTVGKNATAQEGNAVVVAKDGSGNIVWSWHIWVTKQTFAEADLTTVATGNHDYQVTPVNLGWVGDAVSPGTNTFYQWGRKDPFPGTGSVTYSTSSATIADNIKNPTTFYNVSDKPNTSTAYNLWDAKQTGTDNIATATVKTVYDPSPAGFCVPTGNLYYYFGDGEKNRSMSTWDNTNKGATWNLGITGNALFFPATGRRDPGNGNLNYVGRYGYCWSASALGSNANNAPNLIYSSETSKWVWYYSRRSYGFPVRAVAEE